MSAIKFMKILAFSAFLVSSSFSFAESADKAEVRDCRLEEGGITADDTPHGCLGSFHDPKLSHLSNGVLYSSFAYVDEVYSVEHLSDDDTGEDPSQYQIAFGVTYMSLIDIIFFDLSVVRPDGSTAVSETLFAYPFVNEDNETDIAFDFEGELYNGSDLLGPDGIEHDSTTGLMPSSKVSRFLSCYTGGGISGSVLYPVMNISYDIVGYDSALLNALKLVINVPTILDDGPVRYLLYSAKMIIAKNDFDVNCTLPKPQGYINNQHNSDIWGGMEVRPGR